MAETGKTAAKKAAETTAEAADEAVKSALVNEDAFKAAEDFSAAAQEQFQKMFDMVAGNADELRDQFETLTIEMRARAEKTQKHVASVNAELTEAARAEMSDAVQFANDIAKAKTFADALLLQEKYWTNLFETRIARAKELTEASVSVAKETLEPVKTPFASLFDQSKLFDTFFPAKA